ncbi:hypothetical protein JCGZ_05214 [Jatropha curcas]|uniref:Uncharacterized protein n=1 Tax=Jatropha curcas TaxID=180498 RepID=A0A067L0Y4_JATCU|nr:uncharacterized protein LOC105634458 [Jatropha curcas]KDP37724.1 hypothetical protein JCGZ_05214 [Jatropha curcas]
MATINTVETCYKKHGYPLRYSLRPRNASFLNSQAAVHCISTKDQSRSRPHLVNNTKCTGDMNLSMSNSGGFQFTPQKIQGLVSILQVRQDGFASSSLSQAALPSTSAVNTSANPNPSPSSTVNMISSFPSQSGYPQLMIGTASISEGLYARTSVNSTPLKANSLHNSQCIDSL